MREIIANTEYPGFLLKCQEELPLDSGKKIKNFQIAYQTYGSLNAQKNNAILEQFLMDLGKSLEAKLEPSWIKNR